MTDDLARGPRNAKPQSVESEPQHMNISATGAAEVATPDHDPIAHGHQGPLYKMAIGAIGVVFGDIGTSPIYSFRETFAGHHPLAPNAFHIHAVLSMIFWSMMIVVTLKYVMIIMRADNKGEGGSLALLALINRSMGGKKKWTSGIVMLGVFATALFYGDSMITPAISVLSAVEGLTTVNTGLAPFVIPIAIGILVGLFAIQARGTARVGMMFGPVMLIYFAALSVLGIVHIVDRPQVIVAMINPLNAAAFFLEEPLARVPRDGLRRPCADGRRGALRRHGPFRPPADQGFVAVLRPSRAPAQLHGAGRDADVASGRAGPRGRQGPVLLSRVRIDAASARPSGDGRDDHRQPGRDFGSVLGHPASHPARFCPAPPHRPYERERGRADLHSARQLGADDDGPAARADVPVLVQPRGGLRNRGDGRDADRHRAHRGGSHQHVEVESLRFGRRCSCSSSRSTLAISART